MKILAFGDTHGETDFSHLTEPAAQADLVLCVGDVTNFSLELPEVLAALDAFAAKTGKQIHFTHGNHEGSAVRKEAQQHPHLVYLHRDVRDIGDATIFAYGGGGFAERDPDVEGFMHAAQRERSGKRLQIWLFHGPPRDLGVDHIPWHGPTGCQSKRLLIERYAPHLVFSGHIHEAFGTAQRHGKTLLINPGPAGALVEVQERQLL